MRKLINALQWLNFRDEQHKVPLEIKSFLCDKTFTYSSADEIKNATDSEIDDYLGTKIYQQYDNESLATSALNKYLIILIEKNRRTTDEDIKQTPARLKSKSTNVRMCILHSIEPFTKIFTLIGVQVNLYGMEKDSIITEINPKILIQLSRLMCFASFCQAQPFNKLNIILSSSGQLLQLSMCFTTTSSTREWMLLYADDESERFRLKDFVYDSTYLILSYVKQLCGSFKAELNSNGTMYLQFQALI